MKICKIVFVVVFILLCFFCGCDSAAKEENVSKEQTRNITEQIARLYSDAELTNIYSFKGSLEELDQKYPVECLRETEETKRAIYLGNHSIVFVYFDLNGNQSSVSKMHELRHTSDAFKKIHIGDTLTDVMEFDPNGEYLFLYTGVQLPHASSHFTTDGYLVVISYDSSNTVTSVNISMI